MAIPPDDQQRIFQEEEKEQKYRHIHGFLTIVVKKMEKKELYINCKITEIMVGILGRDKTMLCDRHSRSKKKKAILKYIIDDWSKFRKLNKNTTETPKNMSTNV